MTTAEAEINTEKSSKQIGFRPTSEIERWYKNLPMKRRGEALNRVIELGIQEMEFLSNFGFEEMAEMQHLINQELEVLNKNQMTLEEKLSDMQSTVLVLLRERITNET